MIPILEKIEAYLTAKSIEVPPQTTLGKAVAYTREMWPRLIRYIECSYLTPDNNEALCSGICAQESVILRIPANHLQATRSSVRLPES